MLIAILAFSLEVSAQNVRDTVNAGIAAFHSARYDDAIALLTRAVMMDPKNLGAHLYLATSYMQLWIPGNDAPENQERRQGSRRV